MVGVSPPPPDEMIWPFKEALEPPTLPAGKLLTTAKLAGAGVVNDLDGTAQAIPTLFEAEARKIVSRACGKTSDGQGKCPGLLADRNVVRPGSGCRAPVRLPIMKDNDRCFSPSRYDQPIQGRGRALNSAGQLVGDRWSCDCAENPNLGQRITSGVPLLRSIDPDVAAVGCSQADRLGSPAPLVVE